MITNKNSTPEIVSSHFRLARPRQYEISLEANPYSYRLWTTPGLSSLGVPGGGTQILADHLTLSQPGMEDTLSLPSVTCPFGFSDLTTIFWGLTKLAIFPDYKPPGMLCLALPACRRVQKMDFQSQFSTSKIIWIFLNFFFIEEYKFRSTFFVIDIFW